MALELEVSPPVSPKQNRRIKQSNPISHLLSGFIKLLSLLCCTNSSRHGSLQCHHEAHRPYRWPEARYFWPPQEGCFSSFILPSFPRIFVYDFPIAIGILPLVRLIALSCFDFSDFLFALFCSVWIQLLRSSYSSIVIFIRRYLLLMCRRRIRSSLLIDWLWFSIVLLNNLLTVHDFSACVFELY